MVFVVAGGLSPERQFRWCGPRGGAARGGDRGPAPGRAGRHRGRAGQPPPADQALEIMRRSDAGPLGVATLVLVLLIQVSALASLPRGGERSGLGAGVAGLGASGLVLAAVTSRVAVVLATGSPSARPSGFGALVAGRTSATGRVASVTLLLGAVVAAGLAWAGAAAAARGERGGVAGLAGGRPASLGRAAAARRDDRRRVRRDHRAEHGHGAGRPRPGPLRPAGRWPRDGPAGRPRKNCLPLLVFSITSGASRNSDPAAKVTPALLLYS